MKTTEELAQELADKNTKLILETREEAIQKAIAKGYDPKDYYFEDNLLEVIENPAIPYKITLIMKPTKETK